MTHLRIGVLASHGGSNLQAIIDACSSGALDGEVCLVISNNQDSRALGRAEQHDVPAFYRSGKTHPDPQELDRQICDLLEQHDVNLVALAGYMKKVGPVTLERFGGRILNIHPALLPKYGGEGMYGLRVHQAVLEARETTTGVTIHIVDEEYDRGPVVAQCEVPVLPGDSPERLAQRVLDREHAFYVETLARVASGEINLSRL